MRALLSLLIAFTASFAMAQENVANTTSKHSLLIDAGWTDHGFTIGAEYENAYHRTFGIGGYFNFPAQLG